jgi:hypothetical protein
MAKQEELCSFHHSVFSPKLLIGLKSRLSGQHAFSVFEDSGFKSGSEEAILKGDFCCFHLFIQKKGIILPINIRALSSKIFLFIIHF